MNTQKYTKNAPGRLVPTTAFIEVERAGRVERSETTGIAFLPDPLPPTLHWDAVIGKLQADLIAAERSLARLDGRASALPNPFLLLRSFMTREARLSSLIEDTVASPEELALVEAGHATDRDDPHEVLNYVRALQHGLGSQLPLCNRLFKEMHQILLDGVRGNHELPGQFRREQNYIGNRSRGFASARFVPPPHGELLERSMADLELFVNKPPPHVPQLIAIALAHYQFEAIHPFRDGNGRLGRLLIVLSLCRSNILCQPFVHMSDYFAEFENEYRDLLLRVSTHGAFSEWIGFVLRGFARQASEAERRVNELFNLRTTMLEQVTGRRASSLLIKLVDSLFERPALTVNDACKRLSVTTTAARRHIDVLREKGIIRPIEGHPSRQAWYIAHQILNVSDPVERTRRPEL